MDKPTTADIQERHDGEVDRLKHYPKALGPKGRFVEAHNDRGILLKRLEASEKMATAFEDEMGEVHLKLEAAVRELNVSESAYASACERADDYHAANLVLINKLGAAEQRLKIMQGEFDLLKQANKDLFKIAADRTRELENK